MNAPRHLFAAWRQVAPRLRQANRVALFTDFDGTLARIRLRPDQARPLQRIPELLRAISRRGVLVGVVSGRRIEDVRARIGLDRIWYVGAHGYFLRSPGNRSFALANPNSRARVARATRRLRALLRGIGGIRLEPKGATLAVHFRGAPARAVDRARAVVARLLQEEPRLRLLSGKMVWEILPDARVDKWTAIQRILRGGGGYRIHSRGPLIYLGDDSTDEGIFRHMRGISVVVGKHRRSAARFWLRSPLEVRQFLERLLNLWS